VRIDDAFRTPEALIAAYCSFDLLVATRMHAAILALIAGTPVVGIAYEAKTTRLFANLGLPEMAVPIEDADGERLHRMVDDALTRRQALRAHLQTVLPGLRNDALGAARALLGALGWKPQSGVQQ
jgi:colanic acid/amylovoran biosynthesis protein